MGSTTTTQTIIPGPRGLPLVGGRVNLLNMMGNGFAYTRWLHDTYGAVAALAQGDPSYVFVFGPDLNRQLLAHADLFENTTGPFLRASKNTVIGRLLGHNLPVMNGAQHRQHRRLMQPAFHKQQIQRYHADMVALTDQMLAGWRPGISFDALIEMKQLTLRIAVKTLFGVYDEAELEQVGKLLTRTTAIIQSPFFLLAPLNVPGLPFHRANRLAAQLEAYVRSVIVRKRAQGEASDVLAALVHARDEDGAALSDEELIGHAFTLFVAGHETTSNALAWTLFLLDQHPEILADLVDELEQTLQGQAPSLEHLRPDSGHLPLLEGVIKESLRLLPPAAIGIRIAAAPCEIGGYALPKGANIFFSEFVTHRLPELYDDPDRFKPRRWENLTRSPYEYLPFAAGPHMCIGWAFAMQELRVVLAMLLQRYRLAVIRDSIIAPNIGMRPIRGMPMQVHAADRQYGASAVRGKIHELIDLPHR